MDKVSIIIPFYNCRYISEAIESAFNQTYSNLEIIVVNDGSTKFVQKLQPYIDQVIYIEKVNGGTASALNKGISHASGQYISWLSSDDVYHPEKISTQINLMKEHDSSISYSSYKKINKNGTQLTDDIDGRFHFKDRATFYKKLKKDCFINGSTVMIEKEIFKKIGLFNEELKYAHDYDLWLRISQRYQFLYIDQPLVSYRIHQEMGTKRNWRLLVKEFSKIKKKYKNY